MGSVALFAVRLAIAAALVGVGWWLGGAPAALVGAGIGGLLLARPIIELGGDSWRAVRALAWREVQGHHYAFHGRPVRVVEDVAHARWVSVADLRAIVGETGSDATLLVTYPAGTRRDAKGEVWLRDDAVLVHLAREPGHAALKLRQWAEREIAFPAQRVRERLGVRLGKPDAPADD